MINNNPEHLQFKEVEHKFVVDADFDLASFDATLQAMQPTRTNTVSVLDTYYLLSGEYAQPFAIRHRYDEELHHLTIKSFGTDTEVRQEVNIDLGHHAGDQRAQVEAFVDQLGVRWSGSLRKDLSVWYFPDAEVVHYVASSEARTVHCVEFEATLKPSLAEALSTVHHYERATGFDESERSNLSLLQLIFPDIDMSDPML
jgi:adenylate cyclase class IV